jgi:hypothetical protein
MKRILFLLLLTVSVYGQNPSRFAKIQITGNTNSGTATKVNVQEANGEVNTQSINTAFNKNFGLNSGDVVGADNLLNQYSTVPSNWVAQNYTLGSVVFYGGKQWISKIATVAGDVPAVSSKWEEITFESLANKTVAVDQTIINGSTNAVSSNAVFDGLAGKADDNAVVKLTGDQFITGQKTFTNSSSGNGISSNNTSTGSGMFSNNTSTGIGIYSNNTSTGIGIISNQTVTGTGLNYVGQNNGTNTFTVDKFGATTATSFIKSGGTSSQFLKADGSVDSNSYALASSTHNPVTIGTANGLSLSTQQLSLGLASSGVTGALSGTDWNTFNGKFNTPSGLTTNYLPKWNGSGFGNSQIYESSNEYYFDNPNGRITFGNNSTENYIFSTTTLFGAYKIIKIKGNGFEFLNGTSSVFSITPSGNTLFGKTNDAGDGLVQVNGNITASPAVSPNQVVVKSQLDAVASSAGTSGTWSSNCFSSDSKLTGITTKDSNYLKVGSIVNCSISGSFTGYTTSESYTDIQGFLPFNSTVIQPTYLGAAVIHIPTTDEVIQAFIYTFGANGFRLRFKTPTGASKTGVFSVTFQYR